uniref:Uncharacterized protein n=1 Tax=Rhizophora mucronata TaxID=61149 RepID=A0A2P2NY09_RHIMU
MKWAPLPSPRLWIRALKGGERPNVPHPYFHHCRDKKQ